MMLRNFSASFSVSLALLALAIPSAAFAEQASQARCIDYFTAHRRGEVISPQEVCRDSTLLRAMTHDNFDRCIRFYATHPSHGRDDMPSWRCREQRQLDAMDELERRGDGERPRKSGQQEPARHSQSDRSRSNRNEDVTTQGERDSGAHEGSKSPAAGSASSN